MRFTIVADDGASVEIHDEEFAQRGDLWIAQDGVDGWDAPALVRETPIERAMSDGDLEPLTLTQGAKVFTIHGWCLPPSAAALAFQKDRLNSLVGKMLTIVGEDEAGARQMRGYLSDGPALQTRHTQQGATFDLTFTCPDPHKYGPEVAYPVASAYVTVSNAGNCDSWPRVVVTGWVESLSLNLDGRNVRWEGAQEGLEIDFATGEASGGTLSVDNAFPIPPGDHDVGVSALPRGCSVRLVARSCWR